MSLRVAAVKVVSENNNDDGRNDDMMTDVLWEST